MTEDRRTGLSHLPPGPPEEICAQLRQVGLDLPEELLQQFIAVWPDYEAMVRRIPRSRSYGDEPAHVFRPAHLAHGG